MPAPSNPSSALRNSRRNSRRTHSQLQQSIYYCWNEKRPPLATAGHRITDSHRSTQRHLYLDAPNQQFIRQCRRWCPVVTVSFESRPIRPSVFFPRLFLSVKTDYFYHRLIAFPVRQKSILFFSTHHRHLLTHLSINTNILFQMEMESDDAFSRGE